MYTAYRKEPAESSWPRLSIKSAGARKFQFGKRFCFLAHEWQSQKYFHKTELRKRKKPHSCAVFCVFCLLLLFFKTDQYGTARIHFKG